MANWYLKYWGLANQAWICPTAPAAIPPKPGTPMLPGPGQCFAGAIDTAWQTAGPYWWAWWDYEPVSVTNRVGSYAANNWMAWPGWWDEWHNSPWGKPDWVWTKEAQIARTAQTPVFADGVSFWLVWPRETDVPASNLQTGSPTAANMGMNLVTIPRHGSRPSRVPTSQQPQDKLPGSINVSFYDGHVAAVRLENLWQLDWHRDWQAPAKRPGL